MKAVVYKGNGQIVLEERPMPALRDEKDAIVQVTLTTICSSDIHIKHGAVPKAVPGTVLGHEFVGRVVETGGDRERCKEGKARGPGGGECRDFLRRMFFLQTRLCK